MNKDLEKLKELLLDEMSFPDYYTFKFIIKEELKYQLLKLLVGHEIQEKKSKNGKYISITTKYLASSVDDIIKVYLEASKIEGIISL